jgi:hypothetical protein
MTRRWSRPRRWGENTQVQAEHDEVQGEHAEVRAELPEVRAELPEVPYAYRHLNRVFTQENGDSQEIRF